jgi:hypothetical protein
VLGDKFTFITTDDGSPSLRTNDLPFETMHSRAGAFSETLHVYSDVLVWMKEHNLPPDFISVGLGLGYVEFLVTAFYLAYRQPQGQLTLDSFESESELILLLERWLNNLEIPVTWRNAYSYIDSLFANYFTLVPRQVSDALVMMKETGQWRIHSALKTETVFDNRYAGIFYDAFSTKTTPDLWVEEFLRNFLNKSAAKHCCFATYAANSVVKRVLREHGFTIPKKDGYGYKRECTFAYR